MQHHSWKPDKFLAERMEIHTWLAPWFDWDDPAVSDAAREQNAVVVTKEILLKFMRK